MNESKIKARKIGKATKIIGISFLLMVFSYILVYAVGQNSSLIYIVVPFVVAFWVGAVYLTWLAYSKFMGVICALAIVFPPAVFLIVLLSYSKASAFIKENGMKMSFFGAVTSAE